MSRVRKPFAALALAALSLAFSAGCGYSLRPPYNDSIRTIYVPIFRSYRFREDLNIQLTELIKNEIHDRTPYIVVGNPEEADARLEGIVTFDDKNVMVENPFNLQRHVLGTMTVSVTYTDNRTGQTRAYALPAAVVNESASFYPEIGESVTAGFQKVMHKVARDIVNMMADPWGPEYVDRDADRLLEAANRPKPDDDEDEDDEPRPRTVRDERAVRIKR